MVTGHLALLVWDVTRLRGGVNHGVEKNVNAT
jgi:hypothetical protein